jgi:predicted transcriptional regulator
MKMSEFMEICQQIVESHGFTGMDDFNETWHIDKENPLVAAAGAEIRAACFEHGPEFENDLDA